MTHKTHHKLRNNENLHSSSWTYIGYVLVAVGCASAFTGTTAYSLLQQGALQNTQYSASFLPLLLTGIVALGFGVSALVLCRLKRNQTLPAPPGIEPPPLPPPPPP